MRPLSPRTQDSTRGQWGKRIARDRDPAPEDGLPDSDADLSCPGMGPVAGSRARIAGLFGGGPHTTAEGSWALEVVAPAWPNERVLLSRGSGLPHSGPYGERWWNISRSNCSGLRAVGFLPSGQSVAVATSSDLSLWIRGAGHDRSGGGEA